MIAPMAGLAALISVASAADPCDPRWQLPGIDVSSYQGTVDWKRVRDSGVVFAFARVSDGLAVVDQRFADNYAAMKRAGLRRGAYQYFRASADPKAQADLLLAAVRPLGLPDLPLVADVETADGIPPEEVRARLATWLARIERRTRRRPMVYTSPSMGELLAGQFRAHPLWVAHYEVDCPALPLGWDRWTFWQHSPEGRIPGITGPVDLNRFSGPLPALLRLSRRR